MGRLILYQTQGFENRLPVEHGGPAELDRGGRQPGGVIPALAPEAGDAAAGQLADLARGHARGEGGQIANGVHDGVVLVLDGLTHPPAPLWLGRLEAHRQLDAGWRR